MRIVVPQNACEETLREVTGNDAEMGRQEYAGRKLKYL
jgi:hypothetical protein